MTAPRFVLALLAGLAFAVAAPAATVRGIVTRVDPDKKVIELEGRGRGVRGATLTFALSADAQVMFGDQAGKLSDLEVGRRVRVEYEADGDRQVAQVIHVLGGPRPAAATVAVPPANGDAVSGVLRHVGYSDREVIVVGLGAKGPDTETAVAVPESAKVVKDGKEATLDDLKEGDAATVQVEKKDGRASALSIQVGAGAAAGGQTGLEDDSEGPLTPQSDRSGLAEHGGPRQVALAAKGRRSRDREGAGKVPDLIPLPYGRGSVISRDPVGPFPCR